MNRATDMESKKPGAEAKLRPWLFDFGLCLELTGIVLVYQRSHARINVADGLACIDSGDRQMGIPLNFLPFRFQFVLVSQFVEQRGKRILIKHDI